MANGGLLSYVLGMPAHHRERTEQLQDEDRRLRVASLYDRGHSLAQVIPSLSGDARDKAMQQLVSVEQSIADVYHPAKAPGAIQRDWDFVKGLIQRKPRPVPVNYDPSQSASRIPDLPLPGSNITIPGRTVDIRPTPQAMTKQQRQGMARRDEATKAAELDVASAGLSPQQEQQAKQQVDEASRA